MSLSFNNTNQYSDFTNLFSEAMRLISDIKNDHFEPINFIQVTTNKKD